MIRSLLLFAVLLLAPAAFAGPPKVSLTQAVKLAEAFVEKNHIPNRGRFLGSVSWHEDFEHPEKSCWSVAWLPNETGMLDADLVVWVFANGEIKYQDSWA